MLPKIRRLPRPDFLHTKKTGATQRFPDFNLIHCSSPRSYSRFAVVISAKISKKAVVRNRLKRQIYAAVDKLPTTGDFIIFPHLSMLNLNNEDLNSKIHQALSKISEF